MDISQPSFGAVRPGARRRLQGITLAEVLISLAILVLTGVGSVSGFMLLNRYATTNRDKAAAKALCQERIEQIVSLPFRPKDGIVPTVTGQDGNTYYPLGQSATASSPSYDSNNAYTGAANQQTSSTYNSNGEPVTLALQPNGTSTALTPVTGFRTTTVSVANATLSLVRVTVTVTWTTRGQTNSYTLYALRSPD